MVKMYSHDEMKMLKGCLPNWMYLTFTISDIKCVFWGI